MWDKNPNRWPRRKLWAVFGISPKAPSVLTTTEEGVTSIGGRLEVMLWFRFAILSTVRRPKVRGPSMLNALENY